MSRRVAHIRRFHAQAAGGVEATIYDLSSLVADNRRRRDLADWLSQVLTNGPLCLCFNHEWRSLDAPPRPVHRGPPDRLP